MKKKVTKKRASKYDKKLSIDGIFTDVIKISVQPGEKKEMPKKAAKRKK